jgi:hypothetical protein
MFRRFVPTIAVVLGLLCVTAILALEQPAEDPASQPLAEQVKQLSDRVAKLEAQVAELKKRQPLVVMRPSTAPPADSPRVPENWHRREFNGQPYYIVPLDGPPSR